MEKWVRMVQDCKEGMGKGDVLREGADSAAQRGIDSDLDLE